MVMKSIYGSHTICYDPEHVFGRALWKQYGAVHLSTEHQSTAFWKTNRNRRV